MPYCPNCNYEYLSGINICPDCNVSLVDSLPEETILLESDWHLIYISSYEYEANTLKGILESEGIIVNILSQRDSNFPAPGDLSVIKIFVKKEDFNEALALVEEFKKNLKLNLEDEEDE